MSFQAGSVDADGLARTSDGKLYVTIAGASGSTSPAGASGFSTVLAQSFAAVSAPADTSEDVLATITVPANTLGANGVLRITTIWTTNNTAGTKTGRVKYSGAAGTVQGQMPVTTSIGFTMVTNIFNRNATNSQFGSSPIMANDSAGGISVWGKTASAVDTTAATTIVITGQKTVGGDTITLEGYMVEVIRP